YIPTDNVVASSMTIIANECFKKNIPIIGSERAHVTQGALATSGVDFNKLGYETGLQAVQIIEGKKPSDIAIAAPKNMELLVNEDAAKKLNIKIPDDINSKAEKIKGGVK
ncbi:ABC transporter substrate-binding protein, partial [Clostridiaceae bacterium UIB06]|nr:ABC transporter substrate-binding protein [Clostridiaceae bacterium UIB06]